MHVNTGDMEYVSVLLNAFGINTFIRNYSWGKLPILTGY